MRTKSNLFLFLSMLGVIISIESTALASHEELPCFECVLSPRPSSSESDKSSRIQKLERQVEELQNQNQRQQQENLVQVGSVFRIPRNEDFDNCTISAHGEFEVVALKNSSQVVVQYTSPHTKIRRGECSNTSVWVIDTNYGLNLERSYKSTYK